LLKNFLFSSSSLTGNCLELADLISNHHTRSNLRQKKFWSIFQ
jgi:hypothetical protein